MLVLVVMVLVVVLVVLVLVLLRQKWSWRRRRLLRCWDGDSIHVQSGVSPTGFEMRQTKTNVKQSSVCMI